MRTFDLIDALVTTWRALSGYGAPTEVGIPVYDGVCESNEQPPEVWVVVGGREWAALEDSDSVVATLDAEWRSLPMAVGSQDERVAVVCAVGAWTGDAPGGIPDWSTLRATVASTVDDLRTSLNATAALGLVGAVSLVINPGTVHQDFTADGAQVTFEFTVDARLTL